MLKLKKPATKLLQVSQLVDRHHFHHSRMAEAPNSQGKSKSKAEQHHDPILAEEIEGTSEPHASAKSTTSKRTNACMFDKIPNNANNNSNDSVTELMAAKKPKPTPSPASQPVKRGFDAREGLGVYIAHPEKNPEGLVVEYDSDFVVIRDKFPKARYLFSPKAITNISLSRPACTCYSYPGRKNTTPNTRCTFCPPTLPSYSK